MTQPAPTTHQPPVEQQTTVSTTTTTTTTRTTTAATTTRRTAGRRSRLPIAVGLIGSLIASAGARELAGWDRARTIPTHGAAATDSKSLSGMNSFALGLLLGGLRGPLVMFLWTDSENNKTNRDLDGVNTEIEWIRLLQPEFDSVHLFQIWNKAYNISVQMASRANKYDAILGAFDYAHDVDRQKPDDINIIAAIGQIYFDKLGTSQEKFYYRRRVREETRAAKGGNQAPVAAGVAAVRTRLDPILDEGGYVLKSPSTPVPGHSRAVVDGETDDGSELQYLPQFAPYPDGVSTFALAYNYYKRAEVLENVAKQHHENLSDMVIDSRPFLALREWAGEALDRGRRNEMQALLGVKEEDVPASSIDLDRAEATLPLDHPVADPAKLRLAIADYEELSKAVPAAVAENKRHVDNYHEHDRLYRLYVEEARSWQQVAVGDANFLRAVSAGTPSDRAAAVAAATAAYAEAERLNYVILFTFPEFTDPKYAVAVLPPGYKLLPGPGQKGPADLALPEIAKVFTAAEHLRMASKLNYVNTDREEYEQAIRRARSRHNVLAPSPATGPATNPAG